MSGLGEAQRLPFGRLLVVRCGAFGDMVLLTALLRELNALWRVPIDVATSGPWSEPLLRGQPGVGTVFTVRSRKTPYWLAADQRALVRQLRRGPPVPTWFCDGGDAGRALLTRAGIGAPCIVDVNDHRLLPGEHATEQWRRLAALRPPAFAQCAPPGRLTDRHGCELHVGEPQRADLVTWLDARGIGSGRLLLVQVGNKRTMRRGLRRLAVNHKYWPLDRWAAVVAHLRQRHPSHRVLLLGTGPEFALNEELIGLVGRDRVHNVADDLPVPRLVALCAHADGLVTVDSGPAHAAAAVGCPLVVLFGKASPALYRPWGAAGAQVEVLTGAVDGEASMLGIDVGAVTGAWDRLGLRGPSGGGGGSA